MTNTNKDISRGTEPARRAEVTSVTFVTFSTVHAMESSR